MNSKPMSYDCLKTVLQHMDANTRINLSARIPSIRKTEKSVPLKIKTLEFGSEAIYIDNTAYKVGVFRDYGSLKTPKYVQKCNEEGGSCYDIDEYGFEDSSTMEQKLLPEDIVIKPSEIKEPLPRNDDTIRQKEADIIDLKNEISELDTQYKQYLSENGFETIEELAEQLHFAQEQDDENRYQTLKHALLMMSSTNPRIMWKLDEIDKIRHYIKCCNDFQSKTPPPFKSYIQLTVSRSEDGEEGWIGEHIERVEYNKLLPFALRAVSDFIFEGRRHPVYVETFEVEQENIIRVPCDLKLKIRNVELLESPGLAYNALQSIIHCSSFPLKKLKVMSLLNDPIFDSNDFQCELVKDADKGMTQTATLESLRYFGFPEVTVLFVIFQNFFAELLQSTVSRSISIQIGWLMAHFVGLQSGSFPCEKLSIECSGSNAIWLPILMSLQNKNVEKMYNNSIEVDDYVALIRAWVVNGKSVGTVFTFSWLFVRREATLAGQDIIDRVAEEHQNAVKGDRCVTVPMLNRSSQILVTVWENDHEINFLCKCFLQLKVVLLEDGSN